MATALANLNTKLDEITFEDLPEEQINQNQYWVQLHKAIKSEYDTYINKLTAFLKAKNQMAYNYDKGKMQPYTVKEKRTRTVTKTETNKETGLPEKVTREEEYEVEVTKYRDITGDDFGGGQTIAGAYESESGSSDAADNYQNERIYEISNRMQTYSDAAFQDENDNNVKRANADAEIEAVLHALEAEYKILADAQALIEPLLAENALPELKKLVGIYTFDHLDQAGKGTASGKPSIQITEDHVYQDNLDAYVESTWDISEDFASLPAVTDGVPGNNPMLHTDDPLNDNNITALDKWFHTQFPDDAKTLAESIDMLKQLKLMMNQLEAFVVDDMDKYENPYLEAVEIKDGEELPSSGIAADSADTLFADLDFEKLIEEGRDNLYATQYIMGMFSYETSALEGL